MKKEQPSYKGLKAFIIHFFLFIRNVLMLPYVAIKLFNGWFGSFEIWVDTHTQLEKSQALK